MSLWRPRDPVRGYRHKAVPPQRADLGRTVFRLTSGSRRTCVIPRRTLAFRRATGPPRGGRTPRRPAKGGATMPSKLRMRVATVSGVVLLTGAVGAGIAVADASP